MLILSTTQHNREKDTMSAYGKADNPRTVRLITDSPTTCSGRHSTLDSLLDCADCLAWLTTYDD